MMQGRESDIQTAHVRASHDAVYGRLDATSNSRGWYPGSSHWMRDTSPMKNYIHGTVVDPGHFLFVGFTSLFRRINSSWPQNQLATPPVRMNQAKATNYTVTDSHRLDLQFGCEYRGYRILWLPRDNSQGVSSRAFLGKLAMLWII